MVFTAQALLLRIDDDLLLLLYSVHKGTPLPAMSLALIAKSDGGSIAKAGCDCQPVVLPRFLACASAAAFASFWALLAFLVRIGWVAGFPATASPAGFLFFLT